jgi:hypothetical protein
MVGPDAARPKERGRDAKMTPSITDVPKREGQRIRRYRCEAQELPSYRVRENATPSRQGVVIYIRTKINES